MGEFRALSATERQKIEQWIAAHGTPQQVAMRCRIILDAAAGESNVAIPTAGCEPQYGDSMA
jgi:hypothetical protein